MDINSLQKELDRLMNEQNNRSISDFEGYSPNTMEHILYGTFNANSPISFRKAHVSAYAKCPMFNLVRYFLEMVREANEIKLTPKGFLPTKFVHELYDQGFYVEEQFSNKISKLSKERDSLTVNLTRLLAELAGLTKKRNGKLSLTKSGEKLATNHQKLFELLLVTMTHKFNWAYYDLFENENVGRFGFGFSLILLAKYGAERQSDSFYAEKYFKAFPRFLESFEPGYNTPLEYATFCYSVRTFQRFFSFFGLVNLESEIVNYTRRFHISKTEFFDEVFKIQPPQ